MTDYATIFIPDISGYTEFLSKTELDHSSHIINELLELLVESNSTDCTLSEIEGDALLFYLKGEPIAFDEMTRQCLEMFQNFHSRLKLIERDTICQCGACQSASDMTLKFIVHYGTIKEIKVANFSKASGLDMIIAHRLLKNSIGSNEYILASKSYLDRVNGSISPSALTWQSSSEEYPAVGRLEFQYALLGEIKSNIPDPPPREDLAIAVGDDLFELDIAAPMMKVYELLIDLDNRVQWIPTLKRGEGDSPIDRLGARHRCIFDEMTVEVTPEKREIQENEIRYVELNHEANLGLKYFIDCRLTTRGENLTHTVIKIGTESGQELAPEVAAMVSQNIRESFERFKMFCEASSR
jgi:hypothetical protein